MNEIVQVRGRQDCHALDCRRFHLNVNKIGRERKRLSEVAVHRRDERLSATLYSCSREAVIALVLVRDDQLPDVAAPRHKGFHLVLGK